MRSCSGVLTLALLFSACGGGDGPTDTDAVRYDLALTLRLDPADASVGNALGWSTAVPGAQVVIQREGDPQEFTATAAANGTVSFEDLLPGFYDVSFVRVLSAGERALLSTADADVTAAAGGRRVYVGSNSTSHTITGGAGRRGSLVISEIDPTRLNTELGPPGTYNGGGQFLEVYNNSDTTIYLDGKIVGLAFAQRWDFPDYPCSSYTHLTGDPAGVWSQIFYAFPGSGTQYPLPPRAAAAMALDAIDHRPFGGKNDLSGADFEIPGGPNNPAVPEMVLRGPGVMAGANGIHFYIFDAYVLADEFDVAAAERAVDPRFGEELVRIPAAAVLDVVELRGVYDQEPAPTWAECGRLVHENFERQGARILSQFYLESAQRVPLPGSDGILQRTRTSARDFRRLPVTLGDIP